MSDQPLIGGGQGRKPEEIEFAAIVVIISLGLGILVGYLLGKIHL